VKEEATAVVNESTTTEETAHIIKISDEVASTTIDVSTIDQTTARESTTKYEGENKPTEDAETSTMEEITTTEGASDTSNDEPVQTSSADPTMIYTATSSATLDHTMQSNLPGITLESIDRLEEEIPEGCFEGIEDLCRSTNVISCSHSAISDLLVEQVLNRVASTMEIPLYVKEPDFYTSVTHNSTCKHNQEIEWVETYMITSTESREPNTTYAVAEVLLAQTFTAISLLQLHTNSFGTSSVQFACQYVNGDALEFSSVVGGIVSGYTISESQYDCKRLINVPVSALLANSTSKGNLTSKNELYDDLSDVVGRSLEYIVVCVYIVLSYLAAYKAYRIYMKQRTRTDFKTNVNFSFVVLFFVWASGKLLYMILYSVALTDTSFFYIKSVLTLTFFATYFGFYLIVHYRYPSSSF
jgi:hypothetical protein